MYVDVAACQGDSGGSLTILKNDKWYLRGVVSFGTAKKNDNGESVCNEELPSLYADLASSIDWIVKVIKKH
jgi:secreted trypsin-like serine protease